MGGGAISVYVQGRYAYLIDYGTSLMKVVDVSNPASPTLVGSAGTGSTPESIYVQGQYAYAVNYSSGTLQIFNVATPATPSSLGTVTVSGPMSVFVAGRYAYVASYATSALQTFDISGAYVQQLEAGGVEAGTVVARNNLSALDGDFRGGLSVGQSLDVNGNAAVVGTLTVNTLASASATSVCINGTTLSSCSSSRRYKENIQDLSLGLDDVMKMRAVTFKWKGRDEEDLGFVAEEMHEISPLLNNYKNGQIEGVKYGQVSAVLVNAVKELKVQLDQEKRENALLRAYLCSKDPGAEICASAP